MPLIISFVHPGCAMEQLRGVRPELREHEGKQYPQRGMLWLGGFAGLSWDV